ncbi:MAG: MFS transporter [Promethearchaeota archaeon]
MSRDKNRSRDFTYINLINLIANSTTTLLGPMALTLAAVFNVNVLNIGLVNSLYLLIGGFFSIFWGILADKMNRKKLLIISSIICMIGTLIVSFSTSYLFFLIIEIITSIGYAGIMPISFTLITDLIVPERRAHAFGILQMTSLLGVGFGLILGGILVDFLPWWVPFLIIAFNGTIYIILLKNIQEPQRGKLDGFKQIKVMNKEKISFFLTRTDFKELFTTNTNILLIFYSFIKVLNYGAFNFHFITMLEKQLSISTSLATIMMIGTFSIMIIGSPLLGKIADNLFNKRKTAKIEILILIMLIGPSFYLLAFSFDINPSNIWLIVLFIVLILMGAFTTSGEAGIAQSLIGDVVAPHLRSTFFSIQLIVSRIGQGLGISLFILFLDLSQNSYRIAFSGIVLTLMASVIFIIPMRKTIKKDMEKLKLKYKN